MSRSHDPLLISHAWVPRPLQYQGHVPSFVPWTSLVVRTYCCNAKNFQMTTETPKSTNLTYVATATSPHAPNTPPLPAYSSTPPMVATPQPDKWTAMEDTPGCCFADSGACCFSSRGACCFSDHGGCCFSDHEGCCFSDTGGCCFSDDKGCCFGSDGGMCWNGCGGNPLR